MIWLGLFGGLIVGGLIGDFRGAVTLGFLGAIGGFIVKSHRQSKAAAAAGARAVPEQGHTGARPGPGAGSGLEERVARLEATVARLEARLAGSVVADVAPVVAAPEVPAAPETPIAPVVPDAVQAAPQPFARRPPAEDAAPSAPAEPRVPPPPPRPNPIVAWFTGGNTIARVGLVILFFGLAFLLKYAADNQMLPPELRVASVAIGGIALLVLGWRLRTKREGYALGLQGAGVAVLYLTVFGAMKLYHFIPPEVGFVMLALIAVFSAVLAIVQDSAALAVIGAGGGFMAPVLASTGGGSHVMLFGYYLVLNLGIAIIAWFKAWRSLNITGFLFTFLIFGAWGWDGYTPGIFASTEFFLVAFFLVYLAISILVAREAPRKNARYVDTTVVFGVPLAAFALQAATIQHIEYGMAFSAVVIAALYLVLSWRLLKTGRESWTLLAQSFMALGVVFATMAIPLALDARWTSASWALEGAAIIWVGLRQKRTIARYFGLLLQFGAGAAYVAGYHRLPGGYPLVDAAFVGAVLIALAGLWSHRLLLVAGDAVTKAERWLIVPLFGWGLAWTVFAGLDEIDHHVANRYEANAAILFFSALALVFGFLSRRLAWSHAAWTARILLPALFFAALFKMVEGGHLFGRLGWLAWAVAFAAQIWVLRAVAPEKRGAYTTFLHAGTVILAALVGALELHWLAAHYTARGTAWSVAAVIVVPAILLLLLTARAFDTRWPITDHPRAYRYNAALFLALMFAIWSLFANMTHDGSSEPLPYLPLLNALDLGHGLAAMAVASTWLALRRAGIAPPEVLTGRGGLVFAGILAFVWANGVLLRTISHWAGIPYTHQAMTASVLVQASLSIFWALLALTAMVFATRAARRPLWIVGAGLMGVVVAKLFLVDLSNVGGIARIVSFIAVGLLMLVIGYFSPVPPKKEVA